MPELDGTWGFPPDTPPPYVDPPPEPPAPPPVAHPHLVALLHDVVAYRIAYRAGDVTSARSTFDTLEATARELAAQYDLPFA